MVRREKLLNTGCQEKEKEKEERDTGFEFQKKRKNKKEKVLLIFCHLENFQSILKLEEAYVIVKP